MRRGRLTVLEPIELTSVVRAGRRLEVVARDHARRRHVMSFRVPNARVAELHESVMMRWAIERTSLAYVRGHRSGALVNVESLFARLQ